MFKHFRETVFLIVADCIYMTWLFMATTWRCVRLIAEMTCTSRKCLSPSWSTASSSQRYTSRNFGEKVSYCFRRFDRLIHHKVITQNVCIRCSLYCSTYWCLRLGQFCTPALLTVQQLMYQSERLNYASRPNVVYICALSINIERRGTWSNSYT